MYFTSFVSLLALAGLTVGSPAPNNGGNQCSTSWKTQTSTVIVSTTSKCPIVSLPLSGVGVTGTLVPVQSITSNLPLMVRAPEPTAVAEVEARNDGGCCVYSTKTATVTSTTTIKPSCSIVNPGSIGK